MFNFLNQVQQQFANKVASFRGILSAGSQNPFQSIIDAREQARILQNDLFIKYFAGQHFASPGPDGPQPYVNLCYAMIEKVNTWLYGKPPKFRARKDIHPIINELYKELLENSGGELLFTDAGQMTAVTGDGFVQLYWDAALNSGKGGIAARVLNSQRTFVEYKNTGNTSVLNRVVTLWEELSPAGILQTRGEMWHRDYVVIYPNKIPFGLDTLPQELVPIDPTGPDGNTGTGSIAPGFKMYKNPYGELPFVHIRNLASVQDVYGRSDLHDLWITNRELNESVNEYKANVNYHGTPITLLFGVSAKNVEKGGNKIWGNLPEKARVENLEVTQTHEAILKYMGILEKYAGFSQFPVHLFELTDHMANDTSAAAMRLLFLPLLELVDRKQVTQGKGWVEVFEMGVRLMNRFHGLGLEALDGVDPLLEARLKAIPEGILSADMRKKIEDMRTLPFWKTEIVWEEYMPQNKTMVLADVVTGLESGVLDIDDALTLLYETDTEGMKEKLISTQKFLGELIYAKKIGENGGVIPPPAQAPGTDGGGTQPPGTNVDGTVKDDKGGAGRKKKPESPGSVQNRTGQPAENQPSKRTTKGKGGM